MSSSDRSLAAPVAATVPLKNDGVVRDAAPDDVEILDVATEGADALGMEVPISWIQTSFVVAPRVRYLE